MPWVGFTVAPHKKMVIIQEQVFFRNFNGGVAWYFQGVAGDGDTEVTAEWPPGEQIQKLSDCGFRGGPAMLNWRYNLVSIHKWLFPR